MIAATRWSLGVSRRNRSLPHCDTESVESDHAGRHLHNVCIQRQLGLRSKRSRTARPSRRRRQQWWIWLAVGTISSFSCSYLFGLRLHQYLIVLEESGRKNDGQNHAQSPLHAERIGNGPLHDQTAWSRSTVSQDAEDLPPELIMSSARLVQYAPGDQGDYFVFQNLDPNAKHNQTIDWVYRSGNGWRQRHIVEDSRDYSLEDINPDETDDCRLQYDWQRTTHPSCNPMHELDLTRFWAEEYHGERFRLIAKGYWRDVWVVRDEASYPKSRSASATHRLVVLKSIRYRHEFLGRNLDRMRRDALVMDRLTSSKYVVDVYGYCSTSSISEYADGGDILDALLGSNETADTSALTPLDKLQIALQASRGLAALHNIDKEGRPSIAHTDISPVQFIKVGKQFKLNDFNRARFIPWSKHNNSVCSYQIQNNPGKNRSPEEYLYQPQSEKVDIYSFGNILYMLLQEEWPFQDVTVEEAQTLIKQGMRPPMYVDIWNNTDPAMEAIKSAMIQCHEQDPNHRPTARQLELFLRDSLRKILSS